MSVTDHLRTIDTLLPGEPVCSLEVSQQFFDDSSEDVINAATAESEAAYRELAAELTVRWGEPREFTNPLLQGCDNLVAWKGTVLAWRRESGWLALTVCHEDKELPVELLALQFAHP